MDRRQLLLGAAGAGAGSLFKTAFAGVARRGEPSLTGPYLDLTTGHGNMLAMARMLGNLDESKEKYGSASGIVQAVTPGAAVQDLFGCEVFSVGRLKTQPDGSFQFLHRETIFYTDLASGDILFDYKNPMTGEMVKVVDVSNDPWDEKIEAFEPQAPSYGGLIKTTAPRKPFLMDWSLGPDGQAIAEFHINLFYPATLTPDKWPRESSGCNNQVSEAQVTFVPLADLQNAKLTSLQTYGTWNRVTPWLPWLLMGQAPGHVLYQTVTAAYDDVNMTKPKVLAHLAKYHPQMLHAPTSWSDKSLSSLEDYARTQTPAPLLPGMKKPPVTSCPVAKWG